MTIRIALVDDHPIVLDGLERLLRTEEDMDVVARCTSGEEAIRVVRDKVPDVLVLDIRMPRIDGLMVLREIQPCLDRTRVVLLTAGLDEDEVIEAIRNGVRGVVLKEMAPRLLTQCIRKVHAGEQWLEKASVAKAIDKLLRREAGVREASVVLTPRELEIVRLVASGMRNKDIAQKLSIAEGTVKMHLHTAYEKLNVSSRVELTLYAQEKGLV